MRIIDARSWSAEERIQTQEQTNYEVGWKVPKGILEKIDTMLIPFGLKGMFADCIMFLDFLGLDFMMDLDYFDVGGVLKFADAKLAPHGLEVVIFDFMDDGYHFYVDKRDRGQSEIDNEI